MRGIPHRFKDGKEQKLCSKCKEYRDLDWYAIKSEAKDGLSNECARCRNIRNKRRYDANFDFPPEVQTLTEIRQYLSEHNKNKYRNKKKGDNNEIRRPAEQARFNRQNKESRDND